MAKVQGTCDTRFNEVKALFQSYLDSGAELGASIYVDIDGQPAVDLWGGYADAAHTREWTASTIANIWSSTKAVTALAALVLIDRGVLSPYDKVSTYWPEFAANGKQDVEVRHLLSHTAGLPDWDRELTNAEKYDVPFAAGVLAQQAPRWPPGSAVGYHMVTMGHLVGELVRRVTGGTSLRHFVANEIAGPLGADFQIGAKEEDWGRVADMIPPAMPQIPPPSAAQGQAGKGKKEEKPKGEASTPRKPPPSPPSALVEQCMTPEWRRAELGAANGHANAKALARVMSSVTLGGTVDGVRLLSPRTIDYIFEEQANGKCVVTGLPMRVGIGLGLTGKDTFAGWFPESEGRICFWGGWGGSIVIMDLERRMTIAYVMNKMGMTVLGNERTKAYVEAIYKGVKSA